MLSADPLLADPYGDVEMLSALSDPYPDARDQVQDSLRILQGMHEEWKRLLHAGNTAHSERFQHLHSEIAGELQGLGQDLDGISLAINVVETNRRSYPIDDVEMSRRRNFLRSSRGALHQVQESITSPQTTAKLHADRQEALTAKTAPAVGSTAEVEKADARAANEAFLGAQRQEQQRLYTQTEDYLVDIGKSAERLKQAAHTIGKEINHHNHLLEELDQDIDRETEKLNTVMKHVGRLLKTSDHSQICVIIGLAALLFVLLFLVIS